MSMLDKVLKSRQSCAWQQSGTYAAIISHIPCIIYASIAYILYMYSSYLSCVSLLNRL